MSVIRRLDSYHLLQTSPTTEDTPTSVQVGPIDKQIQKVVVKPVDPNDKIKPEEVIALLVINCVEGMIIVNCYFSIVVTLVGNTYALPMAPVWLKR